MLYALGPKQKHKVKAFKKSRAVQAILLHCYNESNIACLETTDLAPLINKCSHY